MAAGDVVPAEEAAVGLTSTRRSAARPGACRAVVEATLDNYAATASFTPVTISGLTAAHTIQVVVDGTKNASSTGTGVVVDRWVVG